MIERCLWIDSASLPRRPAAPLPADADVVIVGAGYTGLSAARILARRGAAAVVLERHAAGWGASGRNAGFVLPGFQPSLGELVRRGGAARAGKLFAWSVEAVRCLEAVVADENLACDYTRCGAVTLAERPSHLRALEAEHLLLRDVAGHETVLLDRTEVTSEVGSDRYHGGLLDPAAGSLHPARYCAGLAEAAQKAGASLVEGTAVRRIHRRHPGFLVETSRGTVRTAEVLVATDGYTAAPAGLRRRVIPIGSHIIATGRLEATLARRLIPGARLLITTRHLLHFFRLSPDGRLVFGGRASFTPVGTARSARILASAMREVFPELATAPVDFAWSGNVGFTLDRLPHAGRLAGVHYALGYSGHGVALATWLGARVADALAGASDLPDLGPLRPVPFYGGRPWFLPLVGAYYRFRDWVRW